MGRVKNNKEIQLETLKPVHQLNNAVKPKIIKNKVSRPLILRLSNNLNIAALD